MTQGEAAERAKVCAIGRTWLGTPFRDQGKVKGPNGAVDCAMFLVAVFQEAELLSRDFDPRPYPPQWLLHRDEERFLGIVSRFAAEVERAPIPGDAIVYKVARCFAHGGIVIENDHVIHAWFKQGEVAISPLHDIELSFLPTGKPRPFKLFDLWARRRDRQ